MGDRASDFDKVAGEASYRQTLKRLHEGLAPSFYLEVGVRKGDSLALAKCPAIGIDPKPDVKRALHDKCRVYETTSDEFFSSSDAKQLPDVDLAFIDGMHLAEHALRDFINVERFCTPTSVMVFDDIFPNHPIQAERDRATRMWMGDVWKVQRCLQFFRPDLLLIKVNTSPSGLLIVTNLNRKSRVLSRYLGTLSEFFQNDLPLPRDLLQRRDSISPDDPRLADLLSMLSSVRAKPRPDPFVRKEILEWAYKNNL